ncbi:MAG: lysophospholipid acyltransferase family protein [Pseudomonadota bacterium]
MSPVQEQPEGEMRWNGAAYDPIGINLVGWTRISVRFFGALVLFVVFVPVAALARLSRLYAAQAWLLKIGSRGMLSLLGLKLEVEGSADKATSGFVANHASWLDIFVLYSAVPGQFVAKADVSKWPGIGMMGRLMGTIFIERKTAQARDHLDLLRARLDQGERLIFFPEGTSTDGQRILPFRTTLFEAFMDQDHIGQTALQSVYVQYKPDARYDPRIYSLYGDIPVLDSMLNVLSMGKTGRAVVRFGPIRSVSDYPNRKMLASILEADTRALADPQIASRSA